MNKNCAVEDCEDTGTWSKTCRQHFVHHKSHTYWQVMDTDILTQRPDPWHGPQRHVLRLRWIITLVLFMKSIHQTITVTQNQLSAAYCTVLYCTVLAVLCCAVLCCAVLYCTVLYCTVLAVYSLPVLAVRASVCTYWLHSTHTVPGFVKQKKIRICIMVAFCTVHVARSLNR